MKIKYRLKYVERRYDIQIDGSQAQNRCDGQDVTEKSGWTKTILTFYATGTNLFY